MQKGTAIFYHNHIHKNISRFDQRKDKFIHYRIQFLKQFCQPIQQKIRHIESEVNRYKTMRDTQEQVIERQPDIASLKEEINDYTHTNKYFNDKLSQYEKKSIELQQYNNELKKQVLIMKKQYKNQQEEGQMYMSMIERNSVRSTHNRSENRTNINKSFILPNIHKRLDTDSSISSSKVTTHSNKIVDISKKIQKFRRFRPTQEDILPSLQKSIIKQDPRNQNKQEVNQQRKKMHLVRQRITQFNNTQSLFHQCFEVKKNSVQKSVSQLQAKLIGNRQEFLRTCHAIGSKEQKISYEIFERLSCDEILTLFISFIWLNKRINAQFQEKRKLIMDFVKKLPKLQTQY